jgi:uncharacterized glyoxalase superfamily protein PhnB
MKIHRYLSFNGTCDAAFKFYEQCTDQFGTPWMINCHKQG